MFRKSFAAIAAVLAAVAFIFSGCGIYQIGSTLPEELQTVSVATFQNRTGEPQIESTIANSIIQEFQRDGRLSVCDAEEADINVTGNLISYRLESMIYDSNQPKTTKEYKAEIKAEVLAVNRKTGQRIVKRVVTGHTTLSAAGDLVTARRNVLPDVARDLAKEIVSSIVTAW